MTGGMDTRKQMANGSMSTTRTMTLTGMAMEMDPHGQNLRPQKLMPEQLPAMRSSRRSTARARAKVAMMDASIVEANGTWRVTA